MLSCALNAESTNGTDTQKKYKLESLSDSSFEWPSFKTLTDVALLKNYNTRLVVLSTTILGIAAGLVGSFLLMRKRSLMGDALSHACLPGIGIAFMIMVAMGGTGKSLAGLLTGATITGLTGVISIMFIRNTTKIKDDAAMGIVLSVFFGLGIAILGMVQAMPSASAAGLEYFIYGKTASMVMQDFILLSSITLIVIAFSVLLLKEFTALCFDEAFASSQGWPINLLDIIMLALVTAVTVVGLQAVGLILIIAFLITPASAARFWTDDLKQMLLLAAAIGGLSGWIGASISALFPNLPAGAVIVLVAAAIFVFSMIFGSTRGVLLRMMSHHRLKRKVGRQHLLRSIFEITEHLANQAGKEISNEPISFEALLKHRSWNLSELHKLINFAKKEDHIENFTGDRIRLSEAGFGEAARTTRNHRLWEMYLIKHADVAPSHVDRDADAVEHILGADMVRQLEVHLQQNEDLMAIPRSPHETIPQGANS